MGGTINILKKRMNLLSNAYYLLYHVIRIVLLFFGVRKITEPVQIIEIMKADLLSTSELSSTDTGTFNTNQAANAWHSKNTN